MPSTRSYSQCCWKCSCNTIDLDFSKGRCHGLKYLSPLERLPYLKSLTLYYLDELEFIYYEEPLSSESFFPSLETVRLIDCKKLRGWRKMRDDLNDDDDHSSQSYYLSFPRLSQLSILSCFSMTHMPAFPKVKDLYLTFSRVKVLMEATLNMVGSKCSIEFPPFSMLKFLEIGGYTMDLKNLRKDRLQNLTSLNHLSLCLLSAQNFQEIEICIKNTPNYLPLLRKITIRDCLELMALPDWICNISSLHHIYIESCDCLTLLPEGMSRLTNLQTLEITKCPLLLEECETQTSATWPKIAHIPNIILKRSSY
ncbi:unnamed protein product [Trifolium pratense]|uniref:Uncharacterized protein n=1 Tax=Trifolium pratense TaxID=57577 RepID=A0ACB0L7Y2_TRIPR|nr:unnamed protein product [Trifolium pratense]